MSPRFGWLMAGVFAFAAWRGYGWQGLAFAATVIVFWLLLTFNRAVRVMKNAASSPVGHLANAVTFQSGLSRGATMIQIVAGTRSLGRRIDGTDDWVWADDSGDTVTLRFENGHLRDWTLARGAAVA